MKMVKGLFLSLLVLAAVLSGCQKKEPAPGAGQSAAGPKKIAMMFGLGGLGDKGFNDDGLRGLETAKQQLGIDYQYVEPREIAEFEGHLRSFARSGQYELIMGIGFDQASAMSTVAKEFPGQHFTLIDGVGETLPNLESVTFRDHEKTYMIGIIAAMTTRTNKLGFVGGMDIPSINMFAAGYRAGIQSVNPAIQLSIRYVGAWNDTNTGKELARQLYDTGADIVYVAAGGSGLGVFSAAADTNKLAIGCDVNQIPNDPAHIFLSSIRRVDNTVFGEIKKILGGQFTGGMVSVGLKEGALTYTTEGAQVKTPQDIIDRAEQARQDIIDGKITVPEQL
ncbi:MAG: BMP family ABC transporter substrate-binding protein [Treponema sp.]|jgi:basic membrane protein A|nr:BMP family ABC transporter substrate-binding protein [Treponema sp.]